MSIVSAGYGVLSNDERSTAAERQGCAREGVERVGGPAPIHQAGPLLEPWFWCESPAGTVSVYECNGGRLFDVGEQLHIDAKRLLAQRIVDCVNSAAGPFFSADDVAAGRSETSRSHVTAKSAFCTGIAVMSIDQVREEISAQSRERKQ